MNREERTILESMVFTYLVGEMEMNPIPARKKVENMTDEEIEKFLDQPERSNAELPLWNDPRC